MNDNGLLGVLAEKGAVLEGHFRLSSGRHSDTFVQKFRVLEHPDVTQTIGASIASRFEGAFDVVASPAMGAVVLGFSVALAAGTRFIFAERVDGDLVFRRGFSLSPQERVLIVEDVITTGGSAREIVDLVASSGATVVGVGALLDRVDPSRSPDIGAPLTSLISLPAESWEPDRCPLCEQGLPLDDPGSRRLQS